MDCWDTSVTNETFLVVPVTGFDCLVGLYVGVDGSSVFFLVAQYALSCSFFFHLVGSYCMYCTST